jgi:hypothetical protein
MNNVSDLTVSQKESVDGMIEPNDNDSKEPPVHNNTGAQVLQWFNPKPQDHLMTFLTLSDCD